MQDANWRRNLIYVTLSPSEQNGGYMEGVGSLSFQSLMETKGSGHVNWEAMKIVLMLSRVLLVGPITSVK